MWLFWVMGVVFVTLKLTGVIFWSWLWVISPFWIGFLWWLAMVTLAVTLSLKAESIADWYFRRQMKKSRKKNKSS